MQYTVYSLLKKDEHCTFQKKEEENLLVLWENPKNTKITFEYDLGNFV